MGISSIGGQYLGSLRQALGMATMRKAMNKDVQGMASLINTMKESNPSNLQKIAEPHKGSNIDIRV